MKFSRFITLTAFLIAPIAGTAVDGHQNLRRNLGSKKTKLGSGKSSKSCKSSKKSRGDCEVDEIKKASCEDLRDLLFDLTTKINDVGTETLRFSALADELEQTAQMAETGDVSRRKLQLPTNEAQDDQFEVGGQLQASVQQLDQQRELLATGNGRVTELNTMILHSTLGWIGQNANLTGFNAALSESVNALTEENFDLQAERDALAVQIQDLNSHIDDLSELLDDHAELNGQLNASTADLERQIERLKASNAEYSRLNQELDDSINDLQAQNNALAEQNEIFAGLNQDLNATAQELEDQVDRLQDEVDDLANQTSHLESVVDDLQNETDRLQEVNGQLEEHVNGLETEVDHLEDKVEEFRNLNKGLETIASFLNETAGDLDETYEALTKYLAEQIEAYQSVAVETLHNTYIQRVSLWDCGYRDHFGDQDFASNGNLEIPDEMFEEVIDYINERVLKDLCLSKSDFDRYLSEEFDDPIFTSNHFVSGINSYSLLALNYYFPDSGEVGLTADDWLTVGFSCERLPSDKKFLFGA